MPELTTRLQNGSLHLIASQSADEEWHKGINNSLYYDAVFAIKCYSSEGTLIGEVSKLLRYVSITDTIQLKFPPEEIDFKTDRIETTKGIMHIDARYEQVFTEK